MSAHVGIASHPRGTVRHLRSRQVSWGGMGVPASWRRSRGADHGKRSLAWLRDFSPKIVIKTPGGV